MLMSRARGSVAPALIGFSCAVGTGQAASAAVVVMSSGAPPSSYVDHFAMTPDGSGVFLVLNPSVVTGTPSGLYEAPATGGAGLLRSPVPTNGAQVKYFAFTPDSSSVVFRTSEATGKGDLWRYDRTAATLTQLTTTNNVSSPSTNGEFWITPDGSRVVYQVQASPTKWELYSVPISGGDPTRLNGDVIPSSGGVVAASLIGNQVFYVANQDVNSQRNLYVVSPGAGPGVRINAVASDSTATYNVAVSTTAGRLFYTSDSNVFGGPHRLYSSPLAGGAQTLLTPTLAGEVKSAWMSGDGARAIYAADAQVAGRVELFSVPLAGGTPVTLSGTLGTSQLLYTPYTPTVALHGDSVAYATADADGKASLYVTSATSGGPALLDRLTRAQSDPDTLAFSARGDYLVDQRYGGGHELNAYSLSDGLRHSIGTFVDRFLLTPDGGHVLYSDVVLNNPEQLYLANLDGTGRRLLSDDVGGSGIVDFRLSDDGASVIYQRLPQGAVYAAQVPEPTAGFFAAAAVLVLAARRRTPTRSATQSDHRLEETNGYNRNP